MVLLDEGLNKLASEATNLLTKGQWGTGTNSPTASDTGLQTPVAATLLAFDSAVSSANTTQLTHTIPSVTANSNDLTEFELQFANGDSLNRSVGAVITKTSNIEVITITNINFIRQ